MPWLVGRDTIPVSLILPDGSLPTLSSLSHKLVPISFLMNTQKDPLQISRGFPPCSSRSLAFCPRSSSPWSAQTLITVRSSAGWAHCRPLSLCRSPKTLPGWETGATTALLLLPWFPVSLGSMSRPLKSTVSRVWSACFRWKDEYDPCNSILAESRSLCCQLFHLYDCKASVRTV